MTKIEYKDFSVEIETLKPESVLYLLTNGFKQSLADSIAGLGKKLKEEGRDAVSIDAELKAVMQAKFDAILDGSVSVRSVGPRLQGLDKFVAEVAEERLRAHCAKKSIKWPSGKGAAEKIAEWRGKLLASPMGDGVRVEGKKRFAAYIKAQESEVELDFDLGVE